MAQQPKAQKQQDPYVQRGKTLTSSVQRLRGWVGSDPSRAPELADALVELTGHRLLGHAYSAAATDAQEAVKYAAQLLTANGPIGPYTSTADAARYVTAVVQLANIQVGVGLPDAAGRTMASVDDMTKQLADVGVEVRLSAQAAVWALSGFARSALASGDVPTANAYADAALARLIEAGLLDDPEPSYLAMDVERLVSDTRWAAGRAEPALGYLLSAKNRFDAFAGDRLREPGRVGLPVLERSAEPLSGLYGATADRLLDRGETAVGLTVRRTLIDLLQGLVGRLGDAARSDLASAQAALAADLAAERTERAPLGTANVSWNALSPSATYTTTAASVDVEALDLERLREAAAWLDRERPEAQKLERERREAARSDAERHDAEQRAEQRATAEREAAEQAAAEEAERREARKLAAAEESERLERKRRREERLEAHRLEVEQREAAAREAERLEIERREAERRAADPAELERLELERLQTELAELERAEAEQAERAEAEQAERAEAEQAERAEAERREAKRLETERERREAERLEEERAEAERHERTEADRREAERERREAERQEAERQEAERRTAEREQEKRREDERQEEQRAEAERREAAQLEAERLAAERQEAERQEAVHDELSEALRAWDDLKAQGDRRAARAANERVVELLRPRAEADLARFGPQLLTALEELSRARLRGGDIFGSRNPAREAKALAKALAQ